MKAVKNSSFLNNVGLFEKNNQYHERKFELEFGQEKCSFLKPKSVFPYRFHNQVDIVSCRVLD